MQKLYFSLHVYSFCRLSCFFLAKYFLFNEFLFNLAA